MPALPRRKKDKVSGSEDADTDGDTVASGSNDEGIGSRVVGESKKRLKKVKDGATHATKGARKLSRKAYDKSLALVEAGKNEIVGAVQTTVDTVVDYALDQAGEVVKSSLKDPDMPEWVKSGIDFVVDDMWPDVKEETKSTVLSGLHTRAEIDHGEPVYCCPNPLAKLRAFILYHMLPYNKTIWGCMKDPVWWFFKLIACVPIFGVGQFFFFILFMLQDKRDEYQLVSFILRFKGMIFWTTGVITSLVASVQFYVCATQVDNCQRHGPGEPIWLFIVFCLQIVFVWMAFALLPCSQKKGVRPLIVRGMIMRRYDRDGDGLLDADEQRRYNRRRTDAKKALLAVAASEENESRSASGGSSEFSATVASDSRGATSSNDGHADADAQYEPSEYDPYECCCCTCYPNRGGRLRLMVIYDTIIFIIAIIIMAVPMYVGPTKVEDRDPLNDNWRFRATLLYCKIFYGLFSFPFVFFAMPGMGKLLTHSQQTAYNEHGRTVPFVKPKLEPEPDVESASFAQKALRKLRGPEDDDADDDE
eukprot:a677559_27.p2 GENE.a677559_27~~a677559_27.p2  ORF type:complete len:554 (+),score=268.89 a677559_27:64-1662(+)